MSLSTDQSSGAEDKNKANSNDLWNRNTGKQGWEPFHRPISDKIEEKLGIIEIRGIEEVDIAISERRGLLQLSSNSTRTLNRTATQTLQRQSSARRKPEEDEDDEDVKTKTRYFKYRTKDGDLFVKVRLTDEEMDDRCEMDIQEAEGIQAEFLAQQGIDLAAFAGMPGMQDPGSPFDSSLDLSLDIAASIAGAEAGESGLILGIPDDLKKKFGGEEDAFNSESIPWPYRQFEGEIRSLQKIRESRTLWTPNGVVAGDLRDKEYVKAMRNQKGKSVELVAGGFGVEEWVEMTRHTTPYLVGQIGEKVAMMHLRTQGMTSDYGFRVPTYLGAREQSNKECSDLLQFLVERRLEPEIMEATSSSGPAGISRQVRDTIGEAGSQLLQRMTESQIWREYIMAPIMEEGPVLLHGDLWLGNMATDPNKHPVVVGPASWFGPSEYDLAVGETFGMPTRFFEAYRHHIPEIEGYEVRSKVYKLYVLLNHINQPYASKDTKWNRFKWQPDNFNGGPILTNFRSTSVINPGKHQYRSQMEMITRGLTFNPKEYHDEIANLIVELRDLDPPKLGKVFKLWGQQDKLSRNPNKLQINLRHKSWQTPVQISDGNDHTVTTTHNPQNPHHSRLNPSP
eukprot:CAMPEP_0184325904 /NCGR_PEP_ID=MMETSP1049-20130417/142282_1 /TAXON_ID=77928 /ORGANISM="Proteomonas sulcata, Strain CCMP704" /LENGTH=622 /DNA_ID=CAMNT_0026648069 /DNA_START=12 /DNA_END=1880 /DNA_ORIENTATION=-